MLNAVNWKFPFKQFDINHLLEEKQSKLISVENVNISVRKYCMLNLNVTLVLKQLQGNQSRVTIN